MVPRLSEERLRVKSMIRRRSLFLSHPHIHCQQHCQEDQVQHREFQQIMLFRLPFLCVELIGDKTGHTGDERSESAQVYAHQQCMPLIRKGGQQHGSRHIADHLGGEDRGHSHICIDDRTERILDRIDPLQIPDQNKEEQEGEKKSVVHLQEGPTVRRKHYHDHNPQHDPVVEDACHGEQTYNEQGRIQKHPGHRWCLRRCDGRRIHGVVRPIQEEDRDHKQSQSPYGVGKHGQCEVL